VKPKKSTSEYRADHPKDGQPLRMST
jgi:hypothetical protein